MLTEMVAAANATKSHLMLQWWTPEALYQTYLQTDAELQAVNLPPPTQACRQATIGLEDRCDPHNHTRRVGDPAGSCMEPPYSLQKVMATSLYRLTQDVRYVTSPAQQSPAYPVIQAFSITSLQLGELFDLWLQRRSQAAGGTAGFDLRLATCQWMVEHWTEVMEPFIPRHYPRVSKADDSQYQQPIYYLALALAVVAAVLVLVTALAVHARRHTRVVRFAQMEFLAFLLVGFLLVAVGAIVSIVPPTNGTCVVAVWLIHLGYTLELVPIIVKVAAIQRLMTAARSMRRVELNQRHLITMVLGLTAFVVIFLIFWSTLDPPKQGSLLELSDETTAAGETVVLTQSFCASKSDYWRYLGALWHSLLLLSATVLAFQTRKLRTDFNESQTLALLIYSQFIFVILRIITFSIETADNYSEILRFQSLIYSCDVITAVCVYFVTKLVIKNGGGAMNGTSSRRGRLFGTAATTTGAAGAGGGAHKNDGAQVSSRGAASSGRRPFESSVDAAQRTSSSFSMAPTAMQSETQPPEEEEDVNDVDIVKDKGEVGSNQEGKSNDNPDNNQKNPQEEEEEEVEETEEDANNVSDDARPEEPTEEDEKPDSQNVTDEEVSSSD